MCPDQTIKMTKPVLRGDFYYYGETCVGTASQFLDCNSVGGQGAEEDREEKPRRAAELHNREAEKQALGSVVDWAEGGGTPVTVAFTFSPAAFTFACWHAWTRCSTGEKQEELPSLTTAYWPNDSNPPLCQRGHHRPFTRKPPLRSEQTDSTFVPNSK